MLQEQDLTTTKRYLLLPCYPTLSNDLLLTNLPSKTEKKRIIEISNYSHRMFSSE